MVVNNCAAAVLLAAAALAGRRARGRRLARAADRDRRRVPDPRGRRAVRRACCVEVGTTNRTRLRDYARGAGRRDRRDPARAPVQLPRAGLRRGGVDRGAVRARGAGDRRRRLGRAGRRRSPLLAEEPAVRRSVRAGAALVCFSGDKLLGGPQAGVIVGTARGGRAPRSAIRSRARCGSTSSRWRRWRRRWRCIATRSARAARSRCSRCSKPIPAALQKRAPSAWRARSAARSCEAVAKVGGGALPLLELTGPGGGAAQREPGRDRRAAARGRPAGARRIQDGRVLLDPRTMADEEVEWVAAALRPLTLGTAGHIDHGKTALVRALTGVDTDRLPEEQRRGISIELGLRAAGAAQRPAAQRGRRAGAREARAHDGRGRDRDRPVPAGDRGRRRRDAADARAPGGAARAGRGARRGGDHEGRPGRSGAGGRARRASWCRRPRWRSARTAVAEALERVAAGAAVASRRCGRRAAARRPLVHDPRSRPGGDRHAVGGVDRARRRAARAARAARARACARSRSTTSRVERAAAGQRVAVNLRDAAPRARRRPRPPSRSSRPTSSTSCSTSAIEHGTRVHVHHGTRETRGARGVAGRPLPPAALRERR